MTQSASFAPGPSAHRYSSPQSAGQPCKWPVLPQNAHKELLMNTVYVRDQRRILVFREAQRREGCQLLVKRFTSQLLYGCQELGCTTPTCFTFRKRISPGPVRRLTSVSARAIACHLAAREDPQKYLCPHQPIVNHTQPAPPTARHGKPTSPDFTNDSLRSQHNGHMVDHVSLETHNLEERAHNQFDEPGGHTEHMNDTSAGTSQQPIQPDPLDTELERRKDAKSLTQTLFDTWALRSLEVVATSISTRARSSPSQEESVQIPSRPNSGSDEAVQSMDSYNYINTTWTAPDVPPRLPSSLPRRRASDHTPQSVEDPRPSHPPPSATSSQQSIASSLDLASFLPQSLNHLSIRLVDLLKRMVKSSDPLSRAEREVLSGFRSDKSSPLTWGGSLGSTKYDEALGFVRQSIYYSLGDPGALLQSFRARKPKNDKAFKVDIHPQSTDEALRWLIKGNSVLVFTSLWQSLEALFVTPPELSPHRNSTSKPASSLRSSHGTPGRTSSSSEECQGEYLPDAEACHIILICFHALVAVIPETPAGLGWVMQVNRGMGRTVPEVKEAHPRGPVAMAYAIRRIEVFENEMCIRLACRLIRAIAARTYFAAVIESKSATPEASSSGYEGFMTMLCGHLRRCYLHGYLGQRSLWVSAIPAETKYEDGQCVSGAWPMPEIIVEWVRTVMLKNWDSRPEMPRFSVMGSAVTVMRCLYENRLALGLSGKVFYTPFFQERLDSMEMPVEWLLSNTPTNSLHLLSHSFLFNPLCRVKYFRAINYSNMSRAYEQAQNTKKSLSNLVMLDPADKAEDRADNLLRRALTAYLVLEVRRDNILWTTFDQLWRRERRELLRPLKIKMGMDEGEEGTDIGGVGQEFFRLAVMEALNPDCGLFTTDPETRLSWFQPCSFEPLWKYELIGLLVSLAVYNGAVVPLSFPRALYRKLLGLAVTDIEHIRDGWPALANGLSDLLTWDDGDVEDVFVRTYEFSFDAFGSVVNVDMQRVGRDDPWPAGPGIPTEASRKGKSRLRFNSPVDQASDQEDSRNDHDSELKLGSPVSSDISEYYEDHSRPCTPREEPALVTNENRGDYIDDYIFWLTDKSIRGQYEAFAKGFYTCLDRKAVSMFDAPTLRLLVEGSQEIDFRALQANVRYDDGYWPEHRVIRDFWDIVTEYPEVMKRQLLAFVTASDRVPVDGIQKIMFAIQRSGGDSERLPTTMTCFGRLLLPEYSSKEKLDRKLRIALEHGKGFGVP